MTLIIVDSICHIVPNPCFTTNGGCSHFCLLSAVDPRGYSCDCPEGMLLNNDLANCILQNGTTTVFSPSQLCMANPMFLLDRIQIKSFQIPVWLVDAVAVVRQAVRITPQAAIVMKYAMMQKIVAVMFHLTVNKVHGAHLRDSILTTIDLFHTVA